MVCCLVLVICHCQVLWLKVCPYNLEMYLTCIYCNTWGCWIHPCCFCFQPPVPLTGMLAFTLTSLSKNTCQEVMNICQATMLITSFQSACILTATWLHNVPGLVFMQKVAQAMGRVEKPPGKTWDALQRGKHSVPWPGERAAGTARK